MKTQQLIEQEIGQLNEKKKGLKSEFDKVFSEGNNPTQCRLLAIKINYIDTSINALLWAIGMRDTVS